MSSSNTTVAFQPRNLSARRIGERWRRSAAFACLAAAGMLWGCSGSDEADVLREGDGTEPLGGSGGLTAGGPMPSGGSVATGGALPTTGGTSGVAGAMGGGTGPVGGGGGTGPVGGGGAAVGGSAGSGATAGAGGSMGTGGATSRPDLGEGDGQDVITIGDSYMLLVFTGIQVSLEAVSGRDYRNYAFPGTVISQIIEQYRTARAEDPDIKTIVMTGGGNDILLNSCTNEACLPIVDSVYEKLDVLLPELAQHGVEDVVYVGYGYPNDVNKHQALDYSRELAAQHCRKDAMPRCHFIYDDLTGQISGDGIHPTSAGYDFLGQMVWDYMQAEGIRR